MNIIYAKTIEEMIEICKLLFKQGMCFESHKEKNQWVIEIESLNEDWAS